MTIGTLGGHWHPPGPLAPARAHGTLKGPWYSLGPWHPPGLLAASVTPDTPWGHWSTISFGHRDTVFRILRHLHISNQKVKIVRCQRNICIWKWDIYILIKWSSYPYKFISLDYYGHFGVGKLPEHYVKYLSRSIFGHILAAVFYPPGILTIGDSV